MTRGGGGVGQFLILADIGGRGGLDHMFFGFSSLSDKKSPFRTVQNPGDYAKRMKKKKNLIFLVFQFKELGIQLETSLPHRFILAEGTDKQTI